MLSRTWVAMNDCAIAQHDGGVVLRLRALPNAPRTAPQGPRAGRLVLRVHAPPVEGKANAEVLRWAAEAFGLRKSEVSLIRGGKSRDKDLMLSGATVEDVVAALATLGVDVSG